MSREVGPKFNPEKKSDDVELVEKAKNGDKKAFEELVKKYDTQLKSFIFSKTKSKQDAEDIVQITWIKTFNALGDFENNNFKAWIFRIAHNTFLNKIKRKNKDILAYQENIEGEMVDLGSTELYDGLNSTEKKIFLKEQILILEKAIDSLPNKTDEDKKNQIVLKERFVNGKEYKAIATDNNIPIGTIMSKLHRKTPVLKEIIKEIIAGSDVNPKKLEE